jgi:hypothetical protein
MTGAVHSRPLRFFAVVTLGWIALRIVAQTPAALPPPLLRQPPQIATAASRPAPFAVAASARAAGLALTMPAALAPLRASRVAAAGLIPAPARNTPSRAADRTDEPSSMTIDMMDFIRFSVGFANRHFASDDNGMAGFQPSAAPSPLFPPPQSPAQRLAIDRWRASGWMLWRQGSSLARDTAGVGRLGGSQIGGRIDYDLTPARSLRAAPYARLTSALQRPAAPEAAVGLSIQPRRAIPVTIAVERRIALGDGARNANAALAVGGFGPKPIAAGLEAEGYAQAGVVGFRRGDLFIDGKTSLLRPLSASPLRIGASLSGGAQPGASRLDIGPEVQVRLPLPSIPARLSIEWRHRIAGDARPGSGLAITIGADF